MPTGWCEYDHLQVMIQRYDINKIYAFNFPIILTRTTKSMSWVPYSTLSRCFIRKGSWKPPS